MKHAEIISIGDELLIGQVVNTNASWMSQQLNDINIHVDRVTVIGDDAATINRTLKQALKNHDLVLITGGLGPTKDDITKKTLCRFFKTKLIFNEHVFKQVEDIFSKRNLPMLDINRQQAEVPENCKVLYNAMGTAPGMWFEQGKQVVVSMPGVPYEMQYIMEEHVLPMLHLLNKGQAILHQTIMTQGIGESFLSEKIATWEDALPEHIKLAYLPQPGIVRLRLSAMGHNKTDLRRALDTQIKKLQKLIPEYIFSLDGEDLPVVVGKMLGKQKQTLACAESCTGGNISRLITEIPGASTFFKGSVVAYSNEVKANVLGVSEKDLTKYGAVSESVVRQMAAGVQKLLGTDYAVATSGIAGPDGGSKEKPVGTIWIAVATPTHIISEKILLNDNRIRNIQRTSLHALHLLKKHIG